MAILPPGGAHSALFQHLGATERRARPQRRTRPEPETRPLFHHQTTAAHTTEWRDAKSWGDALRLLGRGNTNAGRYDEWRPPVHICVAWPTRCDRRTLLPLRICRDLSLQPTHRGKPWWWSLNLQEAQAGEYHGATSLAPSSFDAPLHALLSHPSRSNTHTSTSAMASVRNGVRVGSELQSLRSVHWPGLDDLTPQCCRAEGMNHECFSGGCLPAGELHISHVTNTWREKKDLGLGPS